MGASSGYGAASAAWMTACAMGAATRPPVASLTPGWLSTMTAIAILGASAGAKPMIHACAFLPTVWAVPVLAATCMPGTAIRVAVPPLTTPIISWLMVLATSGAIGWGH